VIGVDPYTRPNSLRPHRRVGGDTNPFVFLLCRRGQLFVRRGGSVDGLKLRPSRRAQFVQRRHGGAGGDDRRSEQAQSFAPLQNLVASGLGSGDLLVDECQALTSSCFSSLIPDLLGGAFAVAAGQGTQAPRSVDANPHRVCCEGNRRQRRLDRSYVEARAGHGLQY
jgi:hypothetical protein